METLARDEDLIEEIAAYFDMLARDSQAFADRKIGGKTRNLTRAECWKEAAEDVRSIRLVAVHPAEVRADAAETALTAATARADALAAEVERLLGEENEMAALLDRAVNGPWLDGDLGRSRAILGGRKQARAVLRGDANG